MGTTEGLSFSKSDSEPSAPQITETHRNLAFTAPNQPARPSHMHIMLSRSRNIVSLFRRWGFTNTFRYLDRRCSEHYHEWRLGINTDGNVMMKEIGIHDESAGNYIPCDYRSFRKLMREANIRPENNVFLDYGSGKGRVVVAAGEYPFRRIIGIELSPELNAIAQENVSRCKAKLKCKNITLCIADAAAYKVPTDVTVVFLNHPFDGPMLAKTFMNLRESLLLLPRGLTILAKNTCFFDEELNKHDWLVRMKDLSSCDNKYGMAILQSII